MCDQSLGDILQWAIDLNNKINFCGDEKLANEMEDQLLEARDRFNQQCEAMLDPLIEVLAEKFDMDKISRPDYGKGSRSIKLELSNRRWVIFMAPKFTFSFNNLIGFNVLIHDNMMIIQELTHGFSPDADLSEMVEWARTELPMILFQL